MIRLGLCCTFLDEPIRFRNTTVTALKRLSRDGQLAKLAGLCRHNAAALRQSLVFCRDHGIGDFRVNSQVLPVKSHPGVGYRMAELPGGDEIVGMFRACGRFAKRADIRLSLHPDQFILLSSPDPGITRRSVAELRYHAEVAGWIGADVINIHGGGAYGDPASALARVAANIRRLPAPVRRRLTLENDERVYGPGNLVPLCRETGIPFVYDVHHHRCKPDGQSVADVTRAALDTWDREPMFHVSSPKEGWRGPAPHRHHAYIRPRDVPPEWLDLEITVEVEAKAKEKAVLRLARWLKGRSRPRGD